MQPSPSPSESTAEDVFSGFLERVEAGEGADFEELCTRHPAIAPKLRRIHTRWRTMTVAFSAMSRDVSSQASVGDSASLTALMQRLASGGARWSRYAVGSEIARGAMGRVVKAWDQELRRDVALKILRGPQDDGRMQRRFVEEAQIAAQLDHPGVVPIHELGTDADGRPFFAMRLVRGRDLSEVLELERRSAEGWSRTRVLHVLLRVCETMAYAHHKGVVHRDLKPGNIMVGHFGETYVMDWGLARVVGEPGAATEAARDVDTVRAQIEGEDDGSPLLTRFGDVVGTPAYMAPEQAEGGGARAGPTVDVYALGAILYDLLAGGMPYLTPAQPRNADGILAALRQGPPERLPDLVPGELRAICERAMARAPADRYPTVQSLANDLRAFLELRVVSAYATGGFAELKKWVARNRALAATSAGFVLALVVGVVVAIYLWLDADAARDRAAATSASLAVELDRSQFRNARLALRFDDAASAGDALWRHHLAGASPRATRWALIELAERNPLLATTAHQGQSQASFSPPTRTVLLTGQEGRLAVFDAASLAPLRTLGTEGATFVSVAASHQEPWAVTGDRFGALTIWDLDKGTESRVVRAHTGVVECVEVAGDGRSFASADTGGKVLYWPDRTAEPVPVAAVTQRVVSLAFDSTGRRIAAGTEHGRLHCVTTAGQQLFDVRIGPNQLLALSFTRGDRELWVGSRQIDIVDAESGKVTRSIVSRNGTCRELIQDVDGSLIAGGWWRIDRFVDGQQSELPLALFGVWKMDLDPVARRIVSHRANRADLIDIGQGDVRRLEGAGSIGLSGNGKIAVTFARSELLRVDVATGITTDRFAVPHTGWLQLDHDGGRAALIAQGKTGVTVMDTKTHATVFHVDGPSEAAFNESAMFSPDGAELAVVVGEDRIRRHAAATGKVLGEFDLAGLRILRIRYSLDGSKLAAVFRGSRKVRVFDLAGAGSIDVAFESPNSEPQVSLIAALALDRDGRRVAIGTWTGLVMVYDTVSKQMRSYQSHSGTTWSLAFSPSDSGLLISSSGAGGITFWDLDSGEACYQTWRIEAPLAQVQISDDGRTLACNTNTGLVVVDLEYRERHVAGILEQSLAAARDRVQISPEREAELRAWARAVLARPWPRWQ